MALRGCSRGGWNIYSTPGYRRYSAQQWGGVWVIFCEKSAFTEFWETRFWREICNLPLQAAILGPAGPAQKTPKGSPSSKKALADARGLFDSKFIIFLKRENYNQCLQIVQFSARWLHFFRQLRTLPVVIFPASWMCNCRVKRQLIKNLVVEPGVTFNTFKYNKINGGFLFEFSLFNLFLAKTKTWPLMDFLRGFHNAWQKQSDPRKNLEKT